MTDLVLFYGTQGDVGCLSQWYPHAPFTHEGQHFRTAEHWMMYQKALLFGDDATARQILATHSLKAVKMLGRTVRNFDEGRWSEHREEIVYQGNLLKFSNNKHIRDILLQTGQATLAEASPSDLIWGIGWAASDPAAFIPGHWRGQNLLGKALMRVRKTLASVVSD